MIPIKKISDEAGHLLVFLDNKDLSDIEKLAILKSAAGTMSVVLEVKTLGLMYAKSLGQ